ncbi:MAG: Urease accessory protein UreF [Myxococcales bacterium]|nr:Urease accessory protein UreF [Myxococcales bacterium]
MTSWLVLQLTDSAFPTGGFAHSGGLEAMIQGGELKGAREVEAFCAETIMQTAHGSLPLVAAVQAEPARLVELDALQSAILWSHVAVRASRGQGRSLLDTAARAFQLPALITAREQLTRNELVGHLAPCFGFVTATLGVTRDDALASYLHLTLRSLLSAAVRLGALGPTEAQGVHHALHPALEEALAFARTATLDDLAQTSPITELVQGTHDRLYSRLFQS